jgi:uncharacterized Zn finger protein
MHLGHGTWIPREPAEFTQRDYGLGPKRLPELEPRNPPHVPALLIKKQGDYPEFWRKDALFIETMEELYGRVRAKSEHLK